MLRSQTHRMCSIHARFFTVKAGKRIVRPEEAHMLKHIGELHAKHPKVLAAEARARSIPTPSVHSDASHNPEANAFLIRKMAALKAKLQSPVSAPSSSPAAARPSQPKYGLSKSGLSPHTEPESEALKAQRLAVRRAKRFLQAPKPKYDKVPAHAKPLDLAAEIAPHVDVDNTENVPALVEPVRIAMSRSGHFRAEHMDLDKQYTDVPKVVAGVHHLFLRPSGDLRLIEMAAAQSLNFVASTSSTTGALGHFYNAFLGHQDLDLAALTGDFSEKRWHAAPGTRGPVLLTFRKRVVRSGKTVERSQTLDDLAKGRPLPPSQPGDHVVWGVDNATYGKTDKNGVNILQDLGHLIERQFVTETDTSSPSQLPTGELIYKSDSYRYTTTSNFLLRAQLDSSYTDDTTGQLGVYDLKSRAVAPIRYNVSRYLEYQLYELTKDTGAEQSFEEEYYDLARICFMKFNLQCRLGRQQGVLVVYHNTKSHLGFQKITCDEMEHVLCGVHSDVLAPRGYDASLKLFSEITQHAVETVRAVHADNEPESFRLGIASSPLSPNMVSMFVHCEVGADAQFDADKPLSHRQVIVDYCDSLSEEGLKQLAQAHDIKLKPTDLLDRYTLVAAVETAVADKVDLEVPPLKHLVSLAKSKHLCKFDLHVHHELNGMVVNGRSWNSMTSDQVKAVKTYYTLGDSIQGDVTDEQALMIAKEYFTVTCSSRFRYPSNLGSFAFDNDTDHVGLTIKERSARLAAMSQVGSTPYDYHPYIDDFHLSDRMRFTPYDILRRGKLKYEAQVQRHSTDLASRTPTIGAPGFR